VPDVNYNVKIFEIIGFSSSLNSYFSKIHKDYVIVDNCINKIKHFVRNIIKGILRDPRYGHPCYIASKMELWYVNYEL
jgi:hypothetical protein